MTLILDALIILLIVLVVITVTLFYHARVLAGKVPYRRPLPALDVMRLALGRGAETGRAIHIAPGSGGIGARTGGRDSSAQTLAGLLVAERVASEAALNGAPLLLTSGDAVAHLAMRGTVRQAYQAAGQSQDYDPAVVQQLAQDDALAYAAGANVIYGRQPLDASMVVGNVGDEYLLIGEDGAQRGLAQVAGTANSTGLPLMVLTTPAALIGEEIFAAEAYLSRAAQPQARLMTQDLLRTVAILLLLGGLLYRLLQPVLGLPAIVGF
jgi:hypothetical protein